MSSYLLFLLLLGLGSGRVCLRDARALGLVLKYLQRWRHRLRPLRGGDVLRVLRLHRACKSQRAGSCSRGRRSRGTSSSSRARMEFAAWRRDPDRARLLGDPRTDLLLHRRQAIAPRARARPRRRLGRSAALPRGDRGPQLLGSFALSSPPILPEVARFTSDDDLLVDPVGSPVPRWDRDPDRARAGRDLPLHALRVGDTRGRRQRARCASDRPLRHAPERRQLGARDRARGRSRDP